MIEKKRHLSSETNKLRRKLVHSAWATPVILSVNLPAHAQTSQEPEAMPSCSVEVSNNAIILTSTTLETLGTPINITVTNTGDTPLNHSDTNSNIAGLTLTSFNVFEISEANLQFPNGGIPNPLLPGQSHTVQLTTLQADTCPFDGQLDVVFSRNGSECSQSIQIECVPEQLPILSCDMTLSSNAIGLIGPGFQNISPFIDITITNTGNTPLTHPDTNNNNAGLTFTSADFTPDWNLNTNNGPIPNPLMPGQSHTVQLITLRVIECTENVNGTMNVIFARNGIECVMPITVNCVDINA